MNFGRTKIIALITGFISVLICIIYLLLITVLDYRIFLNDQITNIQENLAVIFFEIEFLSLFLF